MSVPRDQLEGQGSWNLRALLPPLIFFLTAVLALASLLAFRLTGIADLNLVAGSVSPQDIQAPFALSYTSEVLTQRQKEAAANAVAPVYSAPDTQIARQQAEQLRATLSFITSVRADRFSTMEEKLADLALIADGGLSGETTLGLLNLTTEQWQIVQQEAVLVLEQVQRSPIRPGQLSDTLRSIPSLVSLSLPDNQAAIVTELVSLYAAPNSFFSEELTQASRQQATDAVQPVERTFIAGEVVVQSGRVLTDLDVRGEARSVLGEVDERPRLRGIHIAVHPAPGRLTSE